MTLEFFVEKTRATMKLLKNGRAIDSEILLYYHDLGDMLITGLDSLLKRNNIDASALKSFKITGNTGKDSTSYKIAVSFLEALKIKV